MSLYQPRFRTQQGLDKKAVDIQPQVKYMINFGVMGTIKALVMDHDPATVLCVPNGSRII
jgi:hypothetical protein